MKSLLGAVEKGNIYSAVLPLVPISYTSIFHQLEKVSAESSEDPSVRDHRHSQDPQSLRNISFSLKHTKVLTIAMNTHPF